MTNELTRRARKLRRKSSIAEKAVWALLRDRKLRQYKFRRQYPIHPYIADFVCLNKRLIIELDGEQHDLQQGYDARRTHYLNSLGFRVFRIRNGKLFSISFDTFVTMILQALN